MTDLSSVFNNTPLVGFYALGLVAIIASLRVIIHANPVHAILSMIVSLLAVAGIFFIVGAPFAGALEIVVYAGAILVLFVFVIMMLNLGISNDARESRWLSAQTWAIPTGLTIIIAVVLYAMIALGSPAGQPLAMAGTKVVYAKAVGTALFTQYLLLVEVAALLLLAALVAAYHLGKKALDDENISHSSQHDYVNQCDDNSEILANSTDNNSLMQYGDGDTRNAVDMAKPYHYQPVDAQQFVKKGAVKKDADTSTASTSTASSKETH